MRKFYLLMLTLLSAVGAWAQQTAPTVVARMNELVEHATTNTAIESPDWETNATGGAVYSFSNGAYIGGIENEIVLNAVNGDQYLIIAAWVYGQANGCIFGYGDQSDGFKLNQTGDGLSITTKGKSDMDGFNAPDYVKANQWNFVALAIPAKQNGVTPVKARYYTRTKDGLVNKDGFWTKDNNVTLNKINKNNNMTDNMTDPSAESQLFAIGSGNQGGARESYSGLIANVTILTYSGLPENAQVIADLVGPAPTYTVTGAKAALQNRVNEIKSLRGDNPGF